MPSWKTLNFFNHSWVEEDNAHCLIVKLQRDNSGERFRLKTTKAVGTIGSARNGAVLPTMRTLTLKGRVDETVLDKLGALTYHEAKRVLEPNDPRIIADQLELDFAPVSQLRDFADDLT